MNEKIELDIRVPNETRYLSLIGKIGESLAQTLQKYRGDREELAYHINLVLTEAVANAIKHARAESPADEVHISISIQDHRLLIRVYDQGQGFDICSLPTTEQELEDKCLQDHGRGIYIMRALMDRVSYRRMAQGNVLEMEKTLKSP
ncbi:MAG: ATP-binding protein [Syntrophotaleaceae bacterium]